MDFALSHLKNFINKLSNTVNVIDETFNSVNIFKVKSDEENLEDLLKNPKDRILFERTIDELKIDSSKSKVIELSNGDELEVFI